MQAFLETAKEVATICFIPMIFLLGKMDSRISKLEAKIEDLKTSTERLYAKLFK